MEQKIQLCCVCGEPTDRCEDDELAVMNHLEQRVAPLCEACFDVWCEIEGCDEYHTHIRAAYKRFKHLDEVLSNMDDGDPIHATAGILWAAIRADLKTGEGRGRLSLSARDLGPPHGLYSPPGARPCLP